MTNHANFYDLFPELDTVESMPDGMLGYIPANVIRRDRENNLWVDGTARITRTRAELSSNNVLIIRRTNGFEIVAPLETRPDEIQRITCATDKVVQYCASPWHPIVKAQRNNQ